MVMLKFKITKLVHAHFHCFKKDLDTLSHF